MRPVAQCVRSRRPPTAGQRAFRPRAGTCALRRSRCPLTAPQVDAAARAVPGRVVVVRAAAARVVADAVGRPESEPICRPLVTWPPIPAQPVKAQAADVAAAAASVAAVVSADPGLTSCPAATTL